jgi:hypothetical protein
LGENQLYKITKKVGQNRLYVTIGSMESDEPIKLIHELLEATTDLKPGWTVITDLRETLSPDKEHADLIGPAMKLLKAAGLGKAVRVVGQRKLFPGLWERTSSKEGGYTAEVVETMAEAEKLLDDGV